MKCPRTYHPGGPIRALLVSLLGAATLTFGILLLRQQREMGTPGTTRIPGGESATRTVSLDRLRELGF
jgi:hypothetical protein